MKNSNTRLLALSGFFLALALLLPFLTGQIPAVGSQLLPMHLPVLLCGFVCGSPTGLLVGLIAPPLRSLLLGMPPLFPTATAMAFELATYGFLAGLLSPLLPRNLLGTYGALLLAMMGGRAVWGIAATILYGFGETPFTWPIFIGGAFVNALPGILLQLVVIPPLLLALRKSGALREEF